MKTLNLHFRCINKQSKKGFACGRPSVLLLFPMDAAHIVKGRRTKRRQRQPEPPPSSSSSEEEDMANCLILLAQGQPPDSPIEQNKGNAGNGGFCLYECKTCNKCFRSFQALGGHRTSHKKPKLLAQPVQEKKTEDRDQESIQLSISSHPNKGIGKKKVHECTICGSEFASGQALGGHMRRHRPAATLPEVKSQRSHFLIDLDLNLPASADEATNGADLPSIVLLTTALVDCQN